MFNFRLSIRLIPVSLYAIKLYLFVIAFRCGAMLISSFSSIPRYYLINDSVIVKREGKKHKIKIDLGVGNVEFVEVLKGLKEDEEVYKK